MVFSSLTFLAFFLPAVTGLYFISRSPRWRNGVLLVFSLLFYAWGEPRFILVMALTILVNYCAALGMERSEKKSARRLWMLAGVGLSLGILFYFKYFAFLLNSVGSLFGAADAVAAQRLPIGISFYTFQILTYTVDVYRGRVAAQRSLPRLALYISFFPQLIAGPIVNYTYIQPQLEKRDIKAEDFFYGLTRFFTGLGKKVVLANICGEILSELTLTGGVSLLGGWLGALAYTFQIYFDFSGYSDMAIGMGKMFGFRFLENFDHPYISTGVSEFWRRWHISLGAFFREYVYIPMGGNRVGPARQILNILTVWMLTGLWHGASWNFIVWGLYYGLLLIIEKRVLGRILPRIPALLRWGVTMILVMFGWVIFYHESLADGLGQISAMLGFGAAALSDGAAVYCLKRYLWILCLAVLAGLPWGDVVKRLSGGDGAHLVESGPGQAGIVLQALAATGLYVLSLVLLVGSSYNPFLYFRF